MANIKLNNNSYPIPDSVLAGPRADFVAHLGTIAGDGLKVVVGGVEYGVDATKVAGAIAELETMLSEIKPSEGLVYTLNADKTSYSVKNGTCADTDVIIASEYEGLPVTSIGSAAFWGCSSLESIVIPDSVTSIGRSAFLGCSSLAAITIPSSVTYIGEQALGSCEALTTINYNGTKSQWSKITTVTGYDKDDPTICLDWDDNTGNYTIHCTDGDIAK